LLSNGGSLASKVTANSGTTFGGVGTSTGGVEIKNGATLVVGDADGGTLLLKGNVELASGSHLLVNLGGQETVTVLNLAEASITALDADVTIDGAGGTFFVLGLDEVGNAAFIAALTEKFSEITNPDTSSPYAPVFENGVLKFGTAEAIPEPSSYALFGAIAVAGLVALRRRRRAA
jgi:hypothetical protein